MTHPSGHTFRVKVAPPKSNWSKKHLIFTNRPYINVKPWKHVKIKIFTSFGRSYDVIWRVLMWFDVNMTSFRGPDVQIWGHVVAIECLKIVRREWLTTHFLAFKEFFQKTRFILPKTYVTVIQCNRMWTNWILKIVLTSAKIRHHIGYFCQNIFSFAQQNYINVVVCLLCVTFQFHQKVQLQQSRAAEQL